ncbi:MAG: radical SAM/SPASM family putative metalloenzyme maturase [Desulfovibrio sp.]|uniref:radical SAM/SPASM family putative metalloenzyme maturase n=1 Tax=Desulfovibrio sp. 7SRBS1 TaxID=3378064 RepID=UPI003B3EC9CB
MGRGGTVRGKTSSFRSDFPSASISTPFPACIQVEVTSHCNMRCAMCMKQAEGAEIRKTHLPFDLFKKLAPALPQCRALVLSGIGEPLLHPHLPEMAAFARERMAADAMIGFQTNGLALDEELAERLVESGVNTVCISVDTLDSTKGTGELHGQAHSERLAAAFAMLRRAAEKAGRRVRLGVEFVLMADTWRQLPDVIDWAVRQHAAFAIVSHLMPYHASMQKQTLFNPNTPEATALFGLWKALAEAEGVDMQDHFRLIWKVDKTPKQQRLMDIVRCMQEDARKKGIWIHLGHLLEWDRKDMSGLRKVCTDVAASARAAGLELRLPPLQALDDRYCRFVEQGAAFITSEGNVSPCQMLWHQTPCHMDGQPKRVRPWLFGNLGDAELSDIWCSEAFSSFREQVLGYEYAYCSNCTYVPCDDITGLSYSFEADCLGSPVPCGHCMWSMGGLQCLL